MCVRIAVPERRFLFVRQMENPVLEQSFQMHFWFVWFPERYIENENITAVYPLTLLLKWKIKSNFSPILLRKWLLFVFTMLGSTYLLHSHIHWGWRILIITDCICIAEGVQGSRLLVHISQKQNKTKHRKDRVEQTWPLLLTLQGALMVAHQWSSTAALWFQHVF